MSRLPGILRQDSRNRRSSPSDRLSVDDPQADTLLRLLRRVGEEQQPDTTVLIETLRQVSQSVVNENLAKLVNNYLRSRRSRILSYDNFFRALNDFRSKVWGSGSALGFGAVRSRVEPEECSPEDYQTFDALIELIGKVAEYDEGSRMHIADNPDWNHPLHVMATLLSCPLYLTMKATILTTLASFAKSTGSATLIWQYLGPILASLSVTGPKQGLKMEMEDTEVRSGEFPVTRAIILLMSRIYENLAAHTVAPELLQLFQDFVGYVYDAVFLKADGRSFSNPQEHLDLLLSCLLLFEKCLKSLNDISLVFVPALAAHPGYALRQKILEGGAFFEKLVNWLIVCIDEYSTVHSDAVRTKLEEVVTHILAVFGSVIQRHDEFVKLLQQNGRNAAVAGLDAIIANTINARTARKDILFIFVRLLQFKKDRPAIAQQAMEIVDFTTRRSDNHRDWIALLYFDEKLYESTLQSFADCLEVDPNAAEQENRQMETTESLKLVQQTLKMILGNLKQCPYPTIAHVVLGFPVRNGFVSPAALGSDALASSLARILELIEPGKMLFELLPTLTELALDILDSLCQSQQTSKAILEFIRTTWTGDLSIFKLVNQLPLVNNGDNDSYQFLRHQKAILHIIAKEIRTLLDDYMTQSATDLIAALCGFKSGPSSSQQQLSSSVSVHSSETSPPVSLLEKLISIVDLNIPSPPSVRSLSFEYLDSNNVQDALNSANIETDDGYGVHDVAVTLMYLRELMHIYEDGYVGRADVVNVFRFEAEAMWLVALLPSIQDFKVICDFIDRETTVIGLSRARRECFDAWSVLTDVIAESCPPDSFTYPAIPNYFLGMASRLTSKLLSGLSAVDAAKVFQTIFSLTAAFVKFGGPTKPSTTLLDNIASRGYAAEAVKMDYKSVILRTAGTVLSDFVANLAALTVKLAGTASERRACYSSFLLLLKWTDWTYSNYEDTPMGYSQSIQGAASALRLHVRTALETRSTGIISTLLDDAAVSRGTEDAMVVQILCRVWTLMEYEGHFLSRSAIDIIPRLLLGLAKDNRLLKDCIAQQADTDGILLNFETKMNTITSWFSLPDSLPVSPDDLSPTLDLAVRCVSSFDVLRSLPQIKDARSNLTAVQRAWMTGTDSSVFGYYTRIFRKAVDLLVAVLRQIRLRPAHRDALLKGYRYVQYYGSVLGDFLREPADVDDPAWDDICRTVELVSLINHHYFLRELSNPLSTDLSPELLSAELKLGRLLHNLNVLIVKAPEGSYRNYYFDLRKRMRSVQLVSDLVTYLRRIMFEGSGASVNLAAIRPVFARSQVFGKEELARGTVSISYGDLMQHVKSFCGMLLSRVKNLENIRGLIAHSGVSISETDLQLMNHELQVVLLFADSCKHAVPSRREDKNNFYKLFLKEQERDICVDLRSLLNIIEALLMMLVTHLEYAFSQFAVDASSGAAPLSASMRRALLPLLEQENPTTPYDEYYHFNSSVREAVTEEFVKQVEEVYEKVGSDANRFLGVYLGRLISLVNEARA